MMHMGSMHDGRQAAGTYPDGTDDYQDMAKQG